MSSKVSQNPNLIVQASYKMDCLLSVTDFSLVEKTIEILSKSFTRAKLVLQVLKKEKFKVSAVNLAFLIRMCTGYENLCSIRIENGEIKPFVPKVIEWYNPLMIVSEFWIETNEDMKKIPDYSQEFSAKEAKQMIDLLVRAKLRNLDVCWIYDQAYYTIMQSNPRIACFFWDEFWPEYSNTNLFSKVLLTYPRLERTLRQWIPQDSVQWNKIPPS